VKRLPEKEEQRILQATAKPLVEHILTDDGKIDLHVPRFKNNKLTNWLVPHNKKPFVAVHLDETGSRVWKLIIDNKSFAEIVKQFTIESPEISKEEWEERIARFVFMLERGKLVELLFSNKGQ
jgi:hypothetical protein